MRLIAFVLAVFVASGPAAAQSWQEYSYPAYSFTVAFPAEPQIETTTHQVADGRSVEAHVYSVRLNNGVFKVTVAELANTNLEESAVIDHAVKTLSEGGEVKINIPHRIYQVSISSASSNRWYSPAAAPTARRMLSAPFARLVAPVSPTPQARTTHAARGNDFL
jgi:hypothetical protein